MLTQRRRVDPADARAKAVAAAGVRARRVEVERALLVVAVWRIERGAVLAVLLRRRVGEAERGGGRRAVGQRRDRVGAVGLAAGARVEGCVLRLSLRRRRRPSLAWRMADNELPASRV